MIAYEKVSEERKQIIALFHKGLDLYKRQKWDEAIEVFQKVGEMDYNMYTPRLYIERSLDMKTNPPEPDWDGVCTLTTK